MKLTNATSRVECFGEYVVFETSSNEEAVIKDNECEPF